MLLRKRPQVMTLQAGFLIRQVDAEVDKVLRNRCADLRRSVKPL